MAPRVDDPPEASEPMSAPRERFVLAIAIPLTALLAGGALVWAVSRILLAADARIAPNIEYLLADDQPAIVTP